MNYLEFLAVLDQWAHANNDIRGVAIVGSYARQAQHAESDVDVTLLTGAVERYAEDTQWLKTLFPDATNLRVEHWGPVIALRFWLQDLEIEFNLTPLHWSNVPVDPGTANVVNGGLTIVKDTDGVLQRLVDAVADGEVVNIRTHQPGDETAIAELFHRAVHAIPDSVYGAAQKQAWSAKIDVGRWRQRIEQSRPFVAEYQDRLVGFIELDTTGYIDCFYVDPESQQLGIGGQLYQQVVNEARSFGLTELTVDASLVAQPFFIRRGFQVIQENAVDLNGVTLNNVSMRRNLNHDH